MNRVFILLIVILFSYHQRIVSMEPSILSNISDNLQQQKVHQNKTITIYLAGKIPKGNEPPNDDMHWTQNHMHYLQSKLSEFNIILLNPIFKDSDLTNQDSVFGRDMQYVFSSNIIFVDARERRGLGVGAEMMWAKTNGIPVITWAPQNTHYHKTPTQLTKTSTPGFIHPFVKALSDQVVDNIDEGIDWIRQFIASPSSLKIIDIESIHATIEDYKKNVVQNNEMVTNTN